MKIFFAVIFVLISAVLCGCTILARSTYGVAMDERGAGTILSDKKIKLSIQEKLLQNDAIKLLDISTFCYSGEVYLVGEYGTEKEKEKALEIAKAIAHARGAKGARGVTSYLKVAP